MNQDVLARTFFFAVFLILIALLLQILRPFFEPIAWAVVISIVFAPFYQWLLRRLAGRKNLAAALALGVVTLVTIGPFVWFFTALLAETIQLSPLAGKLLQQLAHLERQSLSGFLPVWMNGPLNQFLEFLSVLNIDPGAVSIQLFQGVTNTLPALGGRFALKSIVFVVEVLVLLVTVFFCLRDGTEIYRWFQSKIPMQKAHQEAVLDRLSLMVVAIVRGTLVTAIIQGILAGAGYWVAGVGYPVLLGFATALLAVIPFGGAVWIWVPVVIYLWAIQHFTAAILLFIWCLVLVSTFDNFLRPYFIGSHAKLPFLLTFFGILGGIRVYGALGIVLGPVIIAAVLAFVQIFEKEYFTPGGRR